MSLFDKNIASDPEFTEKLRRMEYLKELRENPNLFASKYVVVWDPKEVIVLTLNDLK